MDLYKDFNICIKLKMYQSNLINDYLDTFFLYYSNLKDYLGFLLAVACLYV